MVLHEPKPGEMAWRCKASPIATANVSATAGKLPTHATPPVRIASATPVRAPFPQAHAIAGQRFLTVVHIATGHVKF